LTEKRKIYKETVLNIGMFFWFSKKRLKKIEEETKKGFGSVKKDIEGTVKWIKHLDSKDKQLFDVISELKNDLSTIKDDVESVKEALSMMNLAEEGKQLSRNQTAVQEQTPVFGVQKSVQTAVQTGNFYNILEGLSTNERVLVFTLMNASEDMKLSYEDLARLLGKERSTVRGQINSIKQKSEGLIKEVQERNGKKRVYIEDVIKEKMAKYAKVRVKPNKRVNKSGKRARINPKNGKNRRSES
jgi:uncharacterized protein YoxC